MTAINVQILDIPFAQYQAESGYGEGEWLRRSHIIDALDGLFHDLHVQPVACIQEEFDGNDATDFGEVFEALVDEQQRHVAYPLVTYDAKGNECPWSLRTGHAKDWVQEQKAAGLVPMKDKTIFKGHYLLKRFMGNQTISSALTVCDRKQPTIRWTDEETGLRLQCRPDRISSHRPWSLDIKTIRDLSGWMSSVDTRRYDIQQIMAVEALTAHYGTEPKFAFACQETARPYRSRLLPIPQDAIDRGRKQYRQALEMIANEQWDLDEPDIEDVDLPAWWIAKYSTGTGDWA